MISSMRAVTEWHTGKERSAGRIRKSEARDYVGLPLRRSGPRPCAVEATHVMPGMWVVRAVSKATTQTPGAWHQTPGHHFGRDWVAAACRGRGRRLSERTLPLFGAQIGFFFRDQWWTGKQQKRSGIAQRCDRVLLMPGQRTSSSGNSLPH